MNNIQKQYSLSLRLFSFLLTILVVSATYINSHAATIYVKHNASGSNNGTSWTNAYTSLQSAISNASSGDEVWVAAGTYKPSAYPPGRTSTNTREYAFYLESGVDYYGGFDGTETTRSQRDYTSNVTILSGDIGTSNSSSDNCYHVLLSINESTAHKLDGFTITKGYANGGTNATINGQSGIWANNGGGIYSYVSSLTISNCIFNDNYGQYGGAIKDIGSPLNVNNTVFSNNTVHNHGGAFDKSYGNITNFTNCVFYNNTANRTSSTMGGALQLCTCTAGTNLTNCTFFNNKAGQGGAVRAYDSPVTAKNTIFYDNYDNGSKTAAGADLWDAGASTRFYMSNCLMQLASTSYTSSNSNNLTTTSNLEYNQDPLFVNSSDPDGARISNGVVLKYKDLDGNNEFVKEIAEGDFYFNLRNETKPDLPNGKEYDLAFGKYTDYITVDDVSQDYTIYGAILGDASAYLLNDNFEKINVSNFDQTQLSNRKDIIGWDWKRFNLDKNAYEILPDMTYLISTNSAYPCKLRFVDYLNDQGISGHPTFEYEIL